MYQRLFRYQVYRVEGIQKTSNKHSRSHNRTHARIEVLLVFSGSLLFTPSPKNLTPRKNENRKPDENDAMAYVFIEKIVKKRYNDIPAIQWLGNPSVEEPRQSIFWLKSATVPPLSYDSMRQRGIPPL